MRKNYKNIIYVSLLALPLTSCGFEPYYVYSMPIYQNNDSHIRPSNSKTVDSDEFVFPPSPFGTSIKMGVFKEYSLSKEELAKNFQNELVKMHAATDRHLYYFDSSKGEEEIIHNLRYLNDSYGTGVPVKVPPFLFSAVHLGTEMTISSQGKFNIGIGRLSSLWDETIENSGYDSLKTAEELAKQKELGVPVYHDPEPLKIQEALLCTPNALDFSHMKLLEFNERTYEIIFNKMSGCEKGAVELTLGGLAKGLAVEEIGKKYSDLYGMINGGSSSIKLLNNVKDDFKITMTNSLYKKYLSSYDSTKPFEYNPEEIYLQLKGKYDISTSGYYEKFFYALDKDGKTTRRHHIIDSRTGYSNNTNKFEQVLVVGKKSFLSDMYSTALMNVDSIAEGEALLGTLYKKYLYDAFAIYCIADDDGKISYHIPQKYASMLLPIEELNYPSVSKIVTF